MTDSRFDWKPTALRDGRFFLTLSRIRLMPAKSGIKKNRPRNFDRILRPVHQNYYSRKWPDAAEKAINALLAPTRLDRGLTAKAHNLTAIPKANLRRWRRMIAEDPEWRPWHTYHAAHRRIFSALEETAIVSFIVDMCISQGLISTDADIREVPMNAFLEKYIPSKDLPPPFQSSAGFINSFKSRNRLTSRKIHDKRRPAVTEH
jgi:hypothetical protein